MPKIITFLAGCAFVAFKALSAQPAKLTVDAMLSSNKPCQFEPVWATLSFFNPAAVVQHVNLGAKQESNIKISVSPSGGGQDIAPSELDFSGFGPPPDIAAPPLKTVEAKVLLNERFSNLPPGSYTVHISIAGMNKTMPLEISAANPEHLKAVCASLSRAVEAIDSAEEMLRAAKALGFVRTSTCVPYVVRLLKPGNAVTPGLMQGLGHTDSLEAADALEVLAGGSDQTLAGYAYGALLSMRNMQSHQSSVRERAEQILARIPRPKPL